MPFLRRAIGRRETRALDESSGQGLINVLRSGGSGTFAGQTVNADTALTLGAVFACVRVLAESTATLPLLLYRRNGDDKERATEHPLYALLHDAPNDEMTSVELIEALVANTTLWGKGYAQIVWDNAGDARELWPLLSRYMLIERKNGVLLYHYDEPGRKRTFQRWEILHVKGLSLNGLDGLSVIGYMRRALGLGLTLDTFGEAFYGNGARPGVVLQYPGILSEEAQNMLRDSWISRHGGPENVNKPAVLEEGVKIETYGMPMEDAQFIQSKMFQAKEIARWFRVQPHKIGILDDATFSNIEHQGLEFVTDTLGPWITRIEKRVSLDLLLSNERPRYFAEFLVDKLLRGDQTARYGAYAIGRQWGWLSRNDIRRKENMNAIDGGDDYLSPLNMVELGNKTAPAQ
jgi:HK97 family phage portal protein